MDIKELKKKITELREMDARSCSMEVITPLYVYRMFGGKIPLEEIEKAFLDESSQD